ncbi:hypothetical protein [Streptomyces sp. ME18-1-4]|uniref:hypothetical protein n=1 Tax=Streptomyces sp. ME18-1-4 TaxID=3028685 RepID=UPI0029A8202E|nr:hypothetical protein [Streptomyces sp. ME18-1-4]MDX3243489.1 hypothetical protein [Streptomyces sp. ME18-1-4]
MASAAEWAEMVSLAVGLHASFSVPYFLLVDMEVWRWPRPVVAAVDRAKLVVWDVVRSDAVWPLLRGWSNTKCDVREIPAEACAYVSDAAVFTRLSLREAAVTAAALLALLTINPGATR